MMEVYVLLVVPIMLHVKVLAECPLSSKQLSPTSMKGRIAYFGPGSVPGLKDCSWKLPPTENSQKMALIIRSSSINDVYCAALSKPEQTTCEIDLEALPRKSYKVGCETEQSKSRYCRVHVLSTGNCFADTSSLYNIIEKDKECYCSEQTLSPRSYFPTTFILFPGTTASQIRNFSISYEYISCLTPVSNPQYWNITTSTTTAPSLVTTTSTQKQALSSAQSKKESFTPGVSKTETGTDVGVYVPIILAIILLIMVFIGIVIYRRSKKDSKVRSGSRRHLASTRRSLRTSRNVVGYNKGDENVYEQVHEKETVENVIYGQDTVPILVDNIIYEPGGRMLPISNVAGFSK